ncbi:hypothetical protein [Brucella intermedia]|uniref:hypothetical protein n=1 Tax=Brucella intermedia TaxID=94625 RepID=UPI0015910B53|nr:hypothetical protein [Brucella intermedia]
MSRTSDQKHIFTMIAAPRIQQKTSMPLSDCRALAAAMFDDRHEEPDFTVSLFAIEDQIDEEIQYLD